MKSQNPTHLAHFQKIQLILAYFLFLGISTLVYAFFYQVQENAYQRPNHLALVNEWLNHQTSLTSFFGGIYYSAICLIIGLFILEMFNVTSRKYILVCLLTGLFLIGCANTWEEWQEFINPPYPDNHGLDILLGWMAVTLNGWITYLAAQSAGVTDLDSYVVPSQDRQVFYGVATVLSFLLSFLAGFLEWYKHGEGGVPWFIGLIVATLFTALISVVFHNKKAVIYSYTGMVLAVVFVYTIKIIFTL